MKLKNKVRRIKDEAEKSGRITAYVSSLEKWNFDGSEKEPYDVEGHNGADVLLVYKRNPLKLADWIDYLKELVDAAKERYWPEKFNADQYLCLDIWTLENMRHELADELGSTRIEVARPGSDPLWSFTDDGEGTAEDKAEWDAYYGDMRKKRLEAFEEITLDKAREMVRHEYLSFGKGLFVRKDEMAFILVDNSEFKYDMKTGYSNKRLMLIVQLWATRVMGLDYVAIKERKDD
jgi:hypothetical protein